ncbi:hypothetical protein [Devosia sp. SL43]|uniref:hypothetical protein n=1 Tax=Devosia sp. SL43 TaxID=2806348 RepID=UPI001F4919B5|nr:hypothetical protein [Devosia sp. SL43]UJW85662.1 hypothetical protein IM737_20130 [Devosia sp. SL43]
MAINREWHALHKMPRNATLDDRIAWHIKHAANCDCREIPVAVRREMEARGLSAATPRSLK